MSEDNQIARARRFRELHEAPGMFLMPNAWNPGSARMLAAAGFPAIATTSGGIALSLGIPDYEGCITLRQTIDAIAGIAAAIEVPLSADLESGYGPNPEDVAETAWRAIDAGAVGGNIEDYTGDRRQPLFDAAHAAERIAAARAAADDTEIKFTLTARTDCYMTGMEAPFAEAVRRCNLYREAGADCLFVPGVDSLATISALVREIDAPLNVMVGAGNNKFAIADLKGVGVKRVSLGGSLARATFGLIRRAAKEMLESGTFSFAEQQVTDAELSTLFHTWTENRV
jgi:2-methylisocitrate lyase-like PEP mutase family enzyme